MHTNARIYIVKYIARYLFIAFGISMFTNLVIIYASKVPTYLNEANKRQFMRPTDEFVMINKSLLGVCNILYISYLISIRIYVPMPI